MFIILRVSLLLIRGDIDVGMEVQEYNKCYKLQKLVYGIAVLAFLPRGAKELL